MNTQQSFHSNTAIHPGKTLLENLEYLCISQSELAERTGLTSKHISNIINEKASITPETALKLEKVLGIKASFWNALEKNYNATLARLSALSRLEEEKQILSKFRETFKELGEHGYLLKIRWVQKNYTEIILALQSFFGIDSLKYAPETNLHAAYRKYKNKKTNANNIAAWLRIGQIKAQKIEVPSYNAQQLEKKLPEIKKLSLSSPQEYLPKIKELLAECGIVLVYAPYLTNTYTQGAVQWVGKDKVMIILKTTKQGVDRFWFNLFHEIGHVLKHGKLKTFIDLEDLWESEEEKEANSFAQNILLPHFDREEVFKYEELRNGIFSLAKKYKVCPSIVAGRLSYEYQADKSVYKTLYPYIERMDYQEVSICPRS